MQRTAESVQQWLGKNPSLDELQARFPLIWEPVAHNIADALSRQDYDALTAMTVAASQPGSRKRPRSKQDYDALVQGEVRRRMTTAALAQARFSLATGVADGPVRFNWFNGTVLQRLLFAHDLERKPVSRFWFRLFWPLLSQRRFLMALVQPKGIYCFYSKQLISGLAELIGTSPCLEIAAGDGTLSRLLTEHGTKVTATDDYSWKDRVQFNDAVLRQEATTALRVHQPEVVICSWPPAANRFERAVFTTRSVQLYVVISTRHEFSSGDWATYRKQYGFDFEEVPALSRLVLPPELDPAVYVFRRKPS